MNANFVEKLWKLIWRIIYQLNIGMITYEILLKFIKVRLKKKSNKTTSTRALVVEAGKTE